MRYLLMVCSDGVATAEKSAALEAGIPEWLAEAERRNVRLGGHVLDEADAATIVRVRDGDVLVTDGPYTETKELAGFDVIDCADLDEAIEIAAKHPVARFHSIEIRPLAGPGEPGGDCGTAAAKIPFDDPAPDGRQRWALLMFLDGIPESDEEEASIVRDGLAWRDEREQSGALVFAHALAHADTATVVRVRDGETLLSDGPFTESKEFIGGFAVIDCRDRDEAAAIAAAHPLARYHMVEARPFADERP